MYIDQRVFYINLVVDSLKVFEENKYFGYITIAYFNISNAKMFLRKICTGKSICPSSETLQLVFVHGISFLLLCGYQEYIIKEWKYYSFAASLS